MRRYETISILRPNAGDEEIKRVIEGMSQIISDEQGTIIELTHWGIKKLAYLIKKETLGYYVYCDYSGTPAAVSEIERKFRIDDQVLKYMTVKLSDSIDSEGIQQAIAKASEKAISAEQDENDEQSEEASETTADQAES